MKITKEEQIMKSLQEFFTEAQDQELCLKKTGQQ